MVCSGRSSASAIPKPNMKSTERSKMSRLFSYLYNSTVLAVVLLTLQFGTVAADSLWKDGSTRAVSMLSHKKAHNVRHILTILIHANTGTTPPNNTTTP